MHAFNMTLNIFQNLYTILMSRSAICDSRLSRDIDGGRLSVPEGYVQPVLDHVIDLHTAGMVWNRAHDGQGFW